VQQRFGTVLLVVTVLEEQKEQKSGLISFVGDSHCWSPLVTSTTFIGDTLPVSVEPRGAIGESLKPQTTRWMLWMMRTGKSCRSIQELRTMESTELDGSKLQLRTLADPLQDH
jgi:hypothetical protein